MRLCPRLLVVVLLMLVSVPVFAAQVTFKPSLALGKTYTDNVGLDGLGEGDYITEITPNFELQTNGNRLNTSLEVTSENFFYMRDTSQNAWYYDLAADASAELVKDFAFLNLGANGYRRAISSFGGLAQSNRNAVGSADRANTFNWLVNPYFKKRFGEKAQGSASYSYQKARNDGLGLSNAKVEGVQAELKSGSSFRRMTWSLNYAKKTTKRSKASNNNEESSTASMDYRIYKKLGVLFRAGHERSDLPGSQDGSYYAGGVRIVPHSRLQIDFLLGKKLKETSISWMPTPRSTLNISWQNKEVGEILDGVWEGSLRLINRRITWSASYSEKITTSEREQVLQSLFRVVEGRFLRKRSQTGFEYRTVKSLISAFLYKERRTLRVINDDPQLRIEETTQELRGGTVSWRWSFATRTTMLLRWGLKKESDDGVHGRFRSMDINFFQKMGHGMEGTVMARRTVRDGEQGYDENSLSAGVKWYF